MQFEEEKKEDDSDEENASSIVSFDPSEQYSLVRGTLVTLF